MLTINKLGCRRDGKVLFADASLMISAGQKVGLVGRNGTGKSSLFSIILGDLTPDEGECRLQQQIRIAHVEQESAALDVRALEHVMAGDAELHALRLELERNAKALDTGGAEAGQHHADLMGRFEDAGGYRLESRAATLLNGLGFSATAQERAVKEFSGGWRMRINLARALMAPSDLLLLDEPTNHLDLDAVLWLEHWLRQYSGTLLLVSHDREFLDRCTTHTLSIEHERLTLSTGNYSSWERLRAERVSHEQSIYRRQEQRRAELQRFVDRFRAKATKARQAQSRLKMLERLTAAAPAHVDSGFQFGFAEPAHLPDPLLILEEATLGHQSQVVLDNVRCTLHGGLRVGLLGPNGAGKSTLLASLLGELPLLQGHRFAAPALQSGYFAQHQVDRLDGQATPLQLLMNQAPELREVEARGFLGGFGFSADRALQTVETLSGGERARLALALIVRTRPNLLLLDEPTNHLDIEMRQALIEALQSFSGALVVVSHDRALLGATVDQYWRVADGRVEAFDDDLDAYARWLQQRRDRGADSKDSQIARARDAPGYAISPGRSDEDARSRRQREAAERARLRPLARAVENDTARLEACEAAMGEIRDRLALGDLYTDDKREELADWLGREAEARKALEAAEEALLASMEALEAAHGGE